MPDTIPERCCFDSIAWICAAATAVEFRPILLRCGIHADPGLARGHLGALRIGGVEVNLPTEVEEAAPGGVARAGSRPGNAARGGRILGRPVEAGAAMVPQQPWSRICMPRSRNRAGPGDGRMRRAARPRRGESA